MSLRSDWRRPDAMLHRCSDLACPLAAGVIKYVIFRAVEGMIWQKVFCPADQRVRF